MQYCSTKYETHLWQLSAKYAVISANTGVWQVYGGTTMMPTNSTHRHTQKDQASTSTIECPGACSISAQFRFSIALLCDALGSHRVSADENSHSGFPACDATPP